MLSVQPICNNFQFNLPAGICVNSKGDIFIAEYGSSKVRKITAKGEVSVFAGNHAGYTDGELQDASFNGLRAIAVDKEDKIYVGDSSNNCIRVISNGIVSTLQHSGNNLVCTNVWGVGLDKDSNIYITSAIPSGSPVTKLTKKDKKKIIHCPGLEYPTGIAICKNGDLVISDTVHNMVKKFKPDGTLIITAGKLASEEHSNCKKITCDFSLPEQVALDSEDNIYVADYNNGCIKKISNDGIVTILEAKFSQPFGICIRNNIFYVTDMTSGRIFKMFYSKWSTSSHSLFPTQIKQQIKTLLILHLRDKNWNPIFKNCQISKLPRDVLYIIFVFVSVNTL